MPKAHDFCTIDVVSPFVLTASFNQAIPHASNHLASNTAESAVFLSFDIVFYNKLLDYQIL